MKKKRWFWVITFLVVVLSCISLCACSHEEPGPKTVVYNGKTYMIDEEAGTISDSEHVYRYEVSGGALRSVIALSIRMVLVIIGLGVEMLDMVGGVMTMMKHFT
ncbi:MAG: hypothetical protein IKK95_01870 [Lachnospiraceae bacterium]|nr:hypothetical protein [Lachnospiraceae bacterium]